MRSADLPMDFRSSSGVQDPHGPAGAPQRERGPASRSGLSWERGHLARMDNRGPSARCGPEARAPRRHHHCHSRPSWPSRPPRNVKGVRRREAACPGSAGILPAWTTAGLRPVAGQRPALPGDTITAIQNPHGPAGAPQRERGPASRSGLSRERGHLARMDNRGPSARCGLEARAPRRHHHCHSRPSWPSRPPRNVKGVRRREAACLGSAGILPAWTTAGLRPVAGQRPALPGRRPMCTFTAKDVPGSASLVSADPEFRVDARRTAEGRISELQYVTLESVNALFGGALSREPIIALSRVCRRVRVMAPVADNRTTA